MTGRGVEQTADGMTVIDDSFNGNPASMVAALDSLKARPVPSGRRIAILGDMLELGVDAPAYHEKLAEHLPGLDGVYCVGPLMRHLYDLVPSGAAWAGTKTRPRSIRKSRGLAPARRRRGGQGQQKDVLGQQVCAKAAGRAYRQGRKLAILIWLAFPARQFAKAEQRSNDQGFAWFEAENDYQRARKAHSRLKRRTKPRYRAY